ncbi:MULTISPECIES: DUF3027 domain-containing protein [unclassified Luteococcus]|uniref:DUF3027 domain-containing protein n=1 Tax=unclassified Luteococcus TaxID=2639923 RepID=UPI00313AD265
MAAVRTAKAPKLDAVTSAAVDQAREAALEEAKDFGVGDHLGTVAEEDRVVTHLFDCPHPAYAGWRWAVTMVRASRARAATVNEVVLLPGEEALLAPQWVPWSDRIQAGDVAPGTLLPTPDNDPRLEPGFTGGELAADAGPAEWSATRAVVHELGLGRERVLSQHGRAVAAERWNAGEAGADNQSTRLAPANCVTCGYFVRLQGGLGTMFGACTNEFSPFDASVVAIDHGCGGHSDVVAEERGVELAEPVFDTISIDDNLFD